MVDFSLKKARTNWKHVTSGSPTKQKSPPSPSKVKQKDGKRNPYTDMKVSAQYSQLPTIDAKERTKVASSMQRRLSIHNANYAPMKVDFDAPLPSMPNEMTMMNQQIDTELSNADIQNQNNYPLNSATKKRGSAIHTVPVNNARSFPSDILQTKSLRRILADPTFNAKTFVHDNLGNATAMEIDRFTSNLSDLSLAVQDEVNQNVNKSYKEILTVNNDLNVASSELKLLRKGINELYEVMQQFLVLAEKRLQFERQSNNQNQNDAQSANASGLLPPMRTSSRGGFRRDRSSVMILEKIWDAELTKLFKGVEGAQKMVSAKPGRHVLLESDNWVELNVTTLKPLQNVKLFLLNDTILIAQKTRDKQNELIAVQSMNLKDVTVQLDNTPGGRLIFQFGSSNKAMYQSRDPKECLQFLDVFRRAKDDLCDIFQAEEEKSKKLKESFTYLSSQQSATRENMRSPVKTQRNSLNNVTPSKSGNVTDQYLLQTITMSMHSRTRSRDLDSISSRLKHIDNTIEEVDIESSRLKFDKAVELILDLESEMNNISDKVYDENEILHSLISLKINQRRQDIIASLSHKIVSTFDIGPLTSGVSDMIKLGLFEEGLDLFLQNRSTLIQDLILQIGSYDNPTNYLTQIAVIRFQIIKKTVLNFEDIFRGASDKFSSILVNWCKCEVENHFKLIDKQLLNDEMLTPESIKSSRKQIDDLKSVGLDFVYKLDEFIKKNNTRIK
ncbi:hypothetical protein Kpol_1065p31 [Vanderwaltozyma polyspora DSM 70294]|uniref:Exocyst complex component EXO84 n=1 Tax=Vanderwaltozyma polyspora (strain ATCC 22028 / DSM 70294 / BCRC 21397 / CBS 2163 / NBRC 10782 / NRRL Y-8283 / UCD 57-17) TaxID=436907 RepID=A7TL52_VANPO|nr:uncharacterized protein Kpol_1065p31 [Vanderwaltozyma polyspora DSM 70294]EDO17015.1 hypothetical protein Kpol_1065p31 [Vanderwaltozyma polyspora DSM 70294]